jgi:hypothetical protein
VEKGLIESIFGLSSFRSKHCLSLPLFANYIAQFVKSVQVLVLWWNGCNINAWLFLVLVFLFGVVVVVVVVTSMDFHSSLLFS